jgi:hypothetical protein
MQDTTVCRPLFPRAVLRIGLCTVVNAIGNGQDSCLRTVALHTCVTGGGARLHIRAPGPIGRRGWP